MPSAIITTKDELLEEFKVFNIQYECHEHPPLFTSEDAKKYTINIYGSHIKNLFVRNKKKSAYFLITIKEHKRIDLSALGSKLDVGRLSFASKEDLVQMLGVQPGSVTPLAVINNKSRNVKLFLDSDLLTENRINIHPMENTATISINLKDLVQFIKSHGYEEVNFIDVPVQT